MKSFIRFVVIADYYLAALLLVWAGVSKIISPAVGDVLESLHAQKMINLDQLLFISRWFPPLEVILGLAALTGIQAVFFARATGLLYLFYTLLLIKVSQGYLLLPIDCGCFSLGTSSPVYLLILRNIFIALPLLLFPRDRGHFSRPKLLFTQN